MSDLPSPLLGKTPRRFTPEEDEFIRTDWRDHVPVQSTALKLGRPWGTVRQRIYRLGLTKGEFSRSGRVTRAFRWAPEHLKDVYRGEGVDAFFLALDEFAKAESVRLTALAGEELAAAQVKKQTLIAEIRAQPMTRREQIIAMRNAGLTLEEVGQMYGITRERVRQITTPDYRSYPKKHKPKHPELKLGRPIGSRDKIPRRPKGDQDFDQLQKWIDNLRSRETELKGQQVLLLIKHYDQLPEDQKQAFQRMLEQRRGQ